MTAHPVVKVAFNPATNERRVNFHCPGCGDVHSVRVNGDPLAGPRWDWNGDLVRPSFAPSIKVSYLYGPESEDRCCHLWVTDGVARFEMDSTHANRGQALPLARWET